MPGPPRYLTAAEVRYRLRCGRTKLQDLRRRRELRYIRIGRAIRFDSASVLAYERAHQSGDPLPVPRYLARAHLARRIGALELKIALLTSTVDRLDDALPH